LLDATGKEENPVPRVFRGNVASYGRAPSGTANRDHIGRSRFRTISGRQVKNQPTIARLSPIATAAILTAARFF